MGLFTSKYKGQFKKEKRRAAKYKEKYRDVKHDYKDAMRDTDRKMNSGKEGMMRTANEIAREMKESRMGARKEGRDYAEEVLKRKVQGLDPEQKSTMEFESNKGIQRQHQAANRRLLGEQGMHGIVGKGGVGYAQQKDLQRLANDARSQSQRDINKIDSDLSLKKLAAMFNIEQGEAAQAGLDRQLAIDELKLDEEQKRQRRYEDQMNRIFRRI